MNFAAPKTHLQLDADQLVVHSLSMLSVVGKKVILPPDTGFLGLNFPNFEAQLSQFLRLNFPNFEAQLSSIFGRIFQNFIVLK